MTWIGFPERVKKLKKPCALASFEELKMLKDELHKLDQYHTKGETIEERIQSIDWAAKEIENPIDYMFLKQFSPEKINYSSFNGNIEKNDIYTTPEKKLTATEKQELKEY